MESNPSGQSSSKISSSGKSSTEYRKMAKKALADMNGHYWTDKDGGHYIDTHGGTEEVTNFIAFWCSSIPVFALHTYYAATNDEDAKAKIAAQWQHIQDKFREEQLTGRLGQAPNTAADDAAWDALYYLRTYQITGDTKALDYARLLVRNSFDHWAIDGDLSNGMWYCDPTLYEGDIWASTYCAAHILVTLEYCDITRGTDDFDQELLDDAMKLYQWIEEHMRRDRVKTYENGLQNGDSYTVNTVDYLYWMDYNFDRSTRTEKNGPDGGTRPDDITDNGSVSALLANMLMSSINAILYRQTGEDIYRQKAVETANSMTKRYNIAGSLINDRDAYTNATFVYEYVKEVLPLEGIEPATIEVIGSTARNIVQDCRTEEGFYKVCWRKIPLGGKACTRDVQKEYEKMQVTATTVSMVCGAALAEQMGLLVYPEPDSEEK